MGIEMYGSNRPIETWDPNQFKEEDYFDSLIRNMEIKGEAKTKLKREAIEFKRVTSGNNLHELPSLSAAKAKAMAQVAAINKKMGYTGGDNIDGPKIVPAGETRKRTFSSEQSTS